MISHRTYRFNNNNIDIFILTPSKDSKDYVVIAMHNSVQVGYCYFSLENNNCKLSRIAITKKEYLGTGIGTPMFLCMEYFAYNNGARYITGLFIPRGYENAYEITSRFYQFHKMTSDNLDFNYSDRCEISKHLDEPRNNHHNVPLVCDKELYNKVSNSLNIFSLRIAVIVYKLIGRDHAVANYRQRLRIYKEFTKNEGN